MQNLFLLCFSNDGVAWVYHDYWRLENIAEAATSYSKAEGADKSFEH